MKMFVVMPKPVIIRKEIITPKIINQRDKKQGNKSIEKEMENLLKFAFQARSLLNSIPNYSIEVFRVIGLVNDI